MALADRPALLLRWRQKCQNSHWEQKAFANHDPLWRETFVMLVRNHLDVQLIYLSTEPPNHVQNRSIN